MNQDASPLSASLLEKVQGLIRDKTRFEPEDVTALSEMESQPGFTLDVHYGLHAKVEEAQINGYFSRNASDHQCEAHELPSVCADLECDARLQRAAAQLDQSLKSEGFAYNAVQEGAYLGHSLRHWRLRTCNPCEGHGRVECHVCYGNKQETCYKCSGNGQINCDVYNCLGGRVSCGTCGGSGQISHQVATTTYYNNIPSTHYHTEYRPCTAYGCYSGRTQCQRCFGTSRIQCNVCYSSGKITCRTCGGVGDLQCNPCAGSGAVGQAAWVDVYVSPDYTLALPDGSDVYATRVAEKEGPHGLARLASQFAFHATNAGSAQRPSLVSARYRGAFRLVQLAASCNAAQYAVVAYGQDLQWLTLDDMLEDLLRADLRDLSQALAHASDQGLFARDLQGLLQPLRVVAASELNAEVVEAVLNEETKPLHADLLSQDYVSGIRTGILGALRHIYTRLAKNFWWKASLASGLLAVLVWVFSGATMALMAGLLTLPVSYFLFRKLVLDTLSQALGLPEKAQRAMAIAAKGKRDQLALAIVLIPSAVLPLALGYLLPHNGPLHASAKPASAQSDKGSATPADAAPTGAVAAALALYSKGDLVAARAQLEKLALGGDSAASGPYGFMVLVGKGLPPSQVLKTPQDWEKQYGLAKPWIEKGLASGDAWALAAKGYMLTQGWGVALDTNKGLALLNQAAARGNVPAMHALGLIRLNGDHVPADAAEARKWFTLAAQKNSASDIYNLGLMDWNGAALSQPNQDSAMALWKRAAALGEERAVKAVAQGKP